MLRVALKGLLGHKLRFLLTGFAVVVGVTFLAGTFVLTDSIQGAFDGLFDEALSGADVYVEAPRPIDDLLAQQPGMVPAVPAPVLEEIRAVDGVADVLGHVEGTAQFLDDEGEPVGAEGPPRLGASYSPLSPVSIAEGRPPERPTEVAVDRGTAELLERGIGDRVDVLVDGEARTYDIVGVTSFGESDNLLGATMATFDVATAQALFEMEGEYTSIGAVAAEDVGQEELRDRVAAAVGDDYEVKTAAEVADSGKAAVGEALGFLTTGLLAFAGVAVFVGAFIIANTFSIVVAQRSREFALLRALGASARQVRLAVLLEALAVGVVASTLGIVAGIGFAVGVQALLDAIGFALPSSGTVVLPRTIVVAYVVGVTVTLLSSLVAAVRASRVAPLEAMRGASGGAEQRLGRRVGAGAGVTVLGMVVLLVGLLADIGADRLAIVGSGALLTLLGVALAAPLFAGPVAAALGTVAARLGFSGRLAQRNARRDRRRTAATASALMIGVALVTFVTIFTASVQGAVAGTLSEQFRADFILQSTSLTTQNLTGRLVDELRAEDELAVVSPVGFAPWIDEAEEVHSMSVLDPDTVGAVIGVDWEEGQADALRSGGMLVAQDLLDDGVVALGDDVTVRFPDGSSLETSVAGSAGEDTQLLGSRYLLGADAVAGAGFEAPPVAVYVTAADDVAAARAAIDAAVGRHPGVRVQDQAEFRQAQQDSLDAILNIFLVLLALALFVALLGIANTLALAVFERTREIGLLRAVGMDRGQAGRMILGEAVIVSVFGALLGLVVGSFFGWAVVRALAEEGIDRVVFPVLRLAVYVALAGVAGAVAALFPAWRAARLDVLEAVTAE
ncbi:MAG: ABC transporter permease [Actinobacteria bacterium]|nr:ABC transporter permease [Actinomycetota bacterium]